MSRSSKSQQNKVQNVGKVGKGSVVTRGGAKLDGPVNQKVAPAGHAPVEGLKNGRNSKLLRSGPITRSGS